MLRLPPRYTQRASRRQRQMCIRDRTYRVAELETVKRIAWFCMNQGEQRLPDVDVDANYRERPAYQEGCLTDEPDLSQYDLDDPLQDNDSVPPDESEEEDE